MRLSRRRVRRRRRRPSTTCGWSRATRRLRSGSTRRSSASAGRTERASSGSHPPKVASVMRRLTPYGVALAGAVTITGAIGIITTQAHVSGLSAFYLLLVLWLGARWGRGPAVAGSIAAFLLYDFYFVPPVGTLTVAGPAELLELVVLLAVALVTSQLAASLRRAQATTEALAADSRALYELATNALRTSHVNDALSMLAQRAEGLKGVERFALVAMDSGQFTPLVASVLTEEEMRQARWSYENAKTVGITIKDGAVRLIRTADHTKAAYLPLANGVVVLGFKREAPEPAELRMLAALIGLADLLADRRRA